MEDENYGMLMFNTRATYISTRAETGLELRFQGNTLNNNQNKEKLKNLNI